MTNEDLTRQTEEALAGCARQKRRWRRQRVVYALVDDIPFVFSSGAWEIFADIRYPAEPRDYAIQFDLIGGGRLEVVETFIRFNDPPTLFDDGSMELLKNRQIVRVTANCDGGVVKRADGEFVIARRPVSFVGMNCSAVVFPRGTDQNIADRAAATLRAIGLGPDEFAAMLAGDGNCAFCGQKLRGMLSRTIGVDWDCSQLFNVPHTRKAAERRQKLRHTLLCEASTSHEHLARIVRAYEDDEV